LFKDTKKERKIKLHIPDVDPEYDKNRQKKIEEDRIKSKLKLSGEQRKRKFSGSEELSKSLLEEDEYLSEDIEEEYDNPNEEDGSGNIGAIKSKFKKKKELSKKKSREEEAIAEKKILGTKSSKVKIEEKEEKLKKKTK